MKKIFLIMVTIILVSFNIEVNTTNAAATIPKFFDESNQYIEYNTENKTYTITAEKTNLPRLVAIDSELSLARTNYYDDTIKFSYKFNSVSQLKTEDDWLMYFTFRNVSGSTPPWGCSFGSFLLFSKDKIILQINDGAASKTTSVSIDIPSIVNSTTNELLDKSKHDVEIKINDEDYSVTVIIDNDQTKKLYIKADLDDKTPDVIFSEGGYSFSGRKSVVELSNLEFENSKTTEIDDETIIVEKPGDDNDDNDDNDGNNSNNEDKKGCNSSAIPNITLIGLLFITTAGMIKFKK